jgi:hypothetical protein
MSPAYEKPLEPSNPFRIHPQNPQRKISLQIACRDMPRSGFGNFVEKVAAADSDAQKARRL